MTEFAGNSKLLQTWANVIKTIFLATDAPAKKLERLSLKLFGASLTFASWAGSCLGGAQL